jgi:hypothetical protein
MRGASDTRLFSQSSASADLEHGVVLRQFGW